MPLRAGLTRCDVCGKVYSNTRLNPHEDGPECRAQQIVNEYEAKGWQQVFNVTLGRIIEQAGAPLEWALGGIHMETVNAFDEYGRTTNKKTAKSTPVQHKVGFSPKDVLRAAAIMTKVNLHSEMRRRGIAALWNVPGALDELTLVIDSVKRMDGNTRSFIVQAIYEAEKNKV